MTESAQPAASETTSSRGWSTKKWVTSIVGGLVLGIALRLLVAFGERLPSFGIVLPAYTIGFLGAVLVHEIGHLTAAVLVGFEVVAFAVWPLLVHRAGQKWRVGIWRPGRSRIGGFVSACPVGTHNLVKKMGWITIGGPAASWILAIAAALLASFAQEGSQNRVFTLLTALAFWSVLFGIASLLPSSGKSPLSDGARLRVLIRGGPQAERFVSILVLFANSMRGQRPREWDPDLVRRASCDLDDHPDSISGQAFRYNWLHDTRQLEAAGPLAEWIAERVQSKESQEAWRLEVAWLQARHYGNLLAARQWFNRVAGPGKGSAARCAYFKAKAAIDLAEHRWDDAGSSAGEVVRESGKLAGAGIATAIRDEAEAILREVESAKAWQERPGSQR